MSRRLEIELTSERADGTWTWRAAGAKQPKGELTGSLLPDGASVGDVLRAEADFALDGIEILSVLAPKAARREPQRLEVTGSPRDDEPLVTTQLAPKGRGARRDRKERGDRRDRGGRGDRADRGDRGPRADRGSGPRGDRPQRSRTPRPDPVPERPKPKRLRPGREHRNAVLADLEPQERPIAEQVLRGGVPAVREAIAKQNEQARAENRPEVPADQLVTMAERLVPRLRAAEWRDRADAALAQSDQLDLRDLRSVVVAAEGNARGDEALQLVDALRQRLSERVEQEQANWIEDMTANLDAGRFVRALRLSSRPPKAGAPLPPELATRLIESVSAGLTPTVNQDLWAAALDALAYSPVRSQVVPAGRPETPSENLLATVRRVGDRLPAVATMFGLDPEELARQGRRRGRGPRRGGKGGDKGARRKGGPGSDASGTRPGMESGDTDAPVSESQVVEVPVSGAEPSSAEVPAYAEAVVASSLEEGAGTPGASEPEAHAGADEALAAGDDTGAADDDGPAPGAAGADPDVASGDAAAPQEPGSPVEVE